MQTYQHTTAKGAVYNLPKKYEGTSVSQTVVNLLTRDGYSAWDIHKLTGIRFQMVRNILVGKGLWEKRADHIKKK